LPRYDIAHLHIGSAMHLFRNSHYKRFLRRQYLYRGISMRVFVLDLLRHQCPNVIRHMLRRQPILLPRHTYSGMYSSLPLYMHSLHSSHDYNFRHLPRNYFAGLYSRFSMHLYHLSL
jgi:hypothetical protein